MQLMQAPHTALFLFIVAESSEDSESAVGRLLP